HVGNAGVAPHDGEHRLVAHPLTDELYRRDREPLLEYGRGRTWHRAPHTAPHIVMMAEGLDVGDHPPLVEHPHGAAQIREMSDAALGQVGVVHQKHIAGPHSFWWEVAHHGVRHRRVGSAGELAATAIKQTDPIVVSLADHRAAGGPLDGVFDLCFDRGEGAFYDLQHDRIDVLV